jgi:hypothetical protein
MDAAQRDGVKLGATLDKINAPCTGFHGSVTCGTLAQIGQTTKNMGIVAGLAAEQVKQTQPMIVAATNSIQSSSEHINGVADSLTKTANSASGLLQTAKTAVAGFQPVLRSAKLEVDDLRTATLSVNAVAVSVNNRVNSPYVTNMMASVSGMSAHWNAISGNFELVTNKFRKDYLAPTPWWKWPIKEFGNTMDIGAAIARHTP